MEGMEYAELVAKSRQMDEAAALCEHNYTVTGFSRIAHPDAQFGKLPAMDEVQFASYLCSHCGSRINSSEMQKWRDAKGERYTTLNTVRDTLLSWGMEDFALQIPVK